MKKYLIIIILLIFVISSCEKDDFCISEVTTPKLIVNFKNYKKPTVLRKLKSLNVWAKDKDTLYKNIETDSIVLPLNPLSDKTIYYFLKKNKYIGSLEFSYKTKEEFISRSCGFRIIYENIKVKKLEPNKWIDSISTTEIKTINNQKNAHLTIFH